MGELKEQLILDMCMHPLFQGMQAEHLSLLLKECEERYYEEHQRILGAEEERMGLYIVLDGIAEIHVQEEVLEVIQKGEIFGFSSLTSFLDREELVLKADSFAEVRAVEKLRTLFIPFTVLESRYQESGVRDYLLSQVSGRLKDVYSSLAEQVKITRGFSESDALVLKVQDIMSNKLISCTTAATIQEVAVLMNEHHISSVLVIDGSELKGIVTERDIVERAVAKKRSLEEKVVSIMSGNVLTISRFSYIYEALSVLLLNGIKHLPVVDMEKDTICGIISLSDLLRKKSENVMKTLKRIEYSDAHSLHQVKSAIYEVFDTLLKEKIPMVDALAIVTKLYDRLVQRVVMIALEDIRANHCLTPPVKFNFYMMGSAGRGEQFILTDQDHFLVYENSDERELVQHYFQLLGEKIVHYLELAGYARCKGLMMASEAHWRGDLTEWGMRVRDWGVRSTNDKLLLAINFFSYRKVFGGEELHKTFEKYMHQALKQCPLLLYRLTQLEAENPVVSLGQPIRSLFKLQTKSIDMKKKMLFPYHHALQILSMVHGVISGTPFERLDALVDKGVISAHFSADVKEAVNQVLALYVRLRWQQMKREEASSSVLVFTTLTTREKEELSLSMKSFKELQNTIFYHFSMKV